jgi:hypothetical protein
LDESATLGQYHMKIPRCVPVPVGVVGFDPSVSPQLST